MRDAVRQYIYRNVAQALSDSWGSERYGRDTWVLEPVLGRTDRPSRGSGLSRNTTGKRIPNLKPVPPLKKPGPAPKYRLQDCPAARGLYRMIGSQPTPGGISVRVIAKCSGDRCMGRVRSFSVVEWCESPQRGCTQCVAQLRRDERKARRASERPEARA